MKRAALLVSAIVLAALGALAAYAFDELSRPRRLASAETTVRVEPGDSFRAVAERLRERGMIRHPLLFRAWARYRGLDRAVRSGEYRVRSPVSPRQLLEILQTVPAVPTQMVTFPEGFSVAQMAELFERSGFGPRVSFLQAAADPRLVAELGLPPTGAEGYLFPDTYAFTAGMQPAAMIRMMVARFREQAAQLDERRVRAGMSEREMVILASIVEKETGRAEERPLIAAVFRNRLRLGMPLQSDPTVIYGISSFDGNLKRAHLEDGSSPYNTYRHRGLPPGPICNPGRASLEAAIAPAESRALYFVSRNDGSHQFSNTLTEHNRAVASFQRSR